MTIWEGSGTFRSTLASSEEVSMAKLHGGLPKVNDTRLVLTGFKTSVEDFYIKRNIVLEILLDKKQFDSIDNTVLKL